MKTYTLTIQLADDDQEPILEHIERAAYRLRKLSKVDAEFCNSMTVDGELFVGVVDGAVVTVNRSE